MIRLLGLVPFVMMVLAAPFVHTVEPRIFHFPNLEDPNVALLEVVKRTHPGWLLGFMAPPGGHRDGTGRGVDPDSRPQFTKNVVQRAPS